MLEETLDYDGKDTVYPRGFGRVEHLRCVRLPDEKLTLPDEAGVDMYGTCYTGGHLRPDSFFRVYEDGVDITSTIDHSNLDGCFTYEGVRSFVLKVVPQGEVTVCGYGAHQFLSEIFFWGSELLSKTLQYYYDNYNRQIDTTIESQTDILSFLSRVAAGCTHAFYLSDTELVLFLMSESVGTSRTINIPAESLSTTKIDMLAPKAVVTHTMSVPSAMTDGIESMLIRNDKDISIITDFSYGDSLKVDANSVIEATVKARLQIITDLWHQERMSIVLPMSGTLPTPGQQIEIFDDRYDRVMTGTFFVRDISYDFSNRQVTISGEGKVA